MSYNHLAYYPIPPAIKVWKKFPPEEIADWLMTLAGEKWSKAYHHGGNIWHRSLRSEAFATILDTHNDRCECESIRSNPRIYWGGGASSTVSIEMLETGSYGLFEPSEYISNLSSPA
jgi:hypothetical protein